MAPLQGMVPKCEGEVVELVIQITSVGEVSSLFDFIIIPHLQFTVGEIACLYCAHSIFISF